VIDLEQKVVWSYKDRGGETITFRFDITGMSDQQMFMMWVKFMNAIGYSLDPAEMETMWNWSAD